MNKELRKSLNISLQSKRFHLPINRIVSEWEDLGIVVSTKVCEVLLQNENIENSPSIENLLNTYEMIKKSLSRYCSNKELNYETEIIFRTLLKIDAEQLSKFLLNPISFLEKDNINDNKIIKNNLTQANEPFLNPDKHNEKTEEVYIKDEPIKNIDNSDDFDDFDENNFFND